MPSVNSFIGSTCHDSSRRWSAGGRFPILQGQRDPNHLYQDRVLCLNESGAHREAVIVPLPWHLWHGRRHELETMQLPSHVGQDLL